ncbi:MAG: 50S ribosomal protein L25 [Desulfuromonadaceae bacterium]|nr:50S ribosomal protein L25 [Desulfuromonadaceae bacterium]
MAEELNVTLREATGKGVARTLRRQELIPGVVYGKGIAPCAITIDPKPLKKIISGEAGWNTLITLAGDGPFSGKVVVLKDAQIHAIRRNLTHADFLVIDLSQKGSFMVPVQPIGKSEGEKVGGSLQVIRHELEVLCLPTDVPTSIDIDVTALNIGDVLHIADVAVPAGLEFPHDVNFTVITVVGHKEEAVDGEEEEVAEETEE